MSITDEDLRSFPNIELVRSSTGQVRSRVRGGLDVWQYVLVARDYGWDRDQTARHLEEPEDRVREALDYYAAFPAEVDAHLEQSECFINTRARLQAIFAEPGMELQPQAERRYDCPDTPPPPDKAAAARLKNRFRQTLTERNGG
jgi:hypothetical protein